MSYIAVRDGRTRITPAGARHAYVTGRRVDVQVLRAEVHRLYLRGYIQQPDFGRDMHIDRSSGTVTVVMRLLKPLPVPMKLRYKIMAWTAMALGGLSTVGWLLWESRYVIGILLAGLLVAACVAGLVALFMNRPGGGCSGVHVKH